eukprot:375908_1
MLSEEEFDGECLKAVEISDINRWGIKNFKHSKGLLKHIKILTDNQEGEINTNNEGVETYVDQKYDNEYGQFEVDVIKYCAEDKQKQFDKMLSVARIQKHVSNIESVNNEENDDESSYDSDDMYIEEKKKNKKRN